MYVIILQNTVLWEYQRAIMGHWNRESKTFLPDWLLSERYIFGIRITRPHWMKFGNNRHTCRGACIFGEQGTWDTEVAPSGFLLPSSPLRASANTIWGGADCLSSATSSPCAVARLPSHLPPQPAHGPSTGLMLDVVSLFICVIHAVPRTGNTPLRHWGYKHPIPKQPYTAHNPWTAGGISPPPPPPGCCLGRMRRDRH